MSEAIDQDRRRFLAAAAITVAAAQLRIAGSFARQNQSSIASSRVSFSIRARRPLTSPSADYRGECQPQHRRKEHGRSEV
jgi:hypothetical protein